MQWSLLCHIFGSNVAPFLRGDSRIRAHPYNWLSQAFAIYTGRVQLRGSPGPFQQNRNNSLSVRSRSRNWEYFLVLAFWERKFWETPSDSWQCHNAPGKIQKLLLSISEELGFSIHLNADAGSASLLPVVSDEGDRLTIATTVMRTHADSAVGSGFVTSEIIPEAEMPITSHNSTSTTSHLCCRPCFST